MRARMTRRMPLGASRRRLGASSSSAVAPRGRSSMVPARSAVAAVKAYRQRYPYHPYSSPASGMVGQGNMIQGPPGGVTRVVASGSGMIGSAGMLWGNGF